MTKEKIWDALHFIPLLATVGLFLLFVAASKTSGVLSDIISVISVIGLIIGWLATLVVGNIKLVQMAFGIIKKGWTIGWSILPLFPICLFAAIVGIRGEAGHKTPGILGLVVFAGMVGALKAIWKKSKNCARSLNPITTAPSPSWSRSPTYAESQKKKRWTLVSCSGAACITDQSAGH
jgi:phosphotransferase system  glucose/maltose/N-acetylglucosamine-specific IIC component